MERIDVFFCALAGIASMASLLGLVWVIRVGRPIRTHEDLLNHQSVSRKRLVEFLLDKGRAYPWYTVDDDVRIHFERYILNYRTLMCLFGGKNVADVRSMVVERHHQMLDDIQPKAMCECIHRRRMDGFDRTLTQPFVAMFDANADILRRITALMQPVCYEEQLLDDDVRSQIIDMIVDWQRMPDEIEGTHWVRTR